jgi:hypothetical protein
MNDSQRIQLSKMINEYNTEDTTNKIRQLKHSTKIQKDVHTFSLLKTKYLNEPDILKEKVYKECYFLFNHYPELLSRLITEELDVSVLFKLIEVLKTIEDGKTDQHEASYNVGLLFKSMYVDKSLHNDSDDGKGSDDKKKPVNDVSWKSYKKIHKV